MAVAFVQSFLSNFITTKSLRRNGGPEYRGGSWNSFRCETTVEKREGSRRVAVKNGNDSLEICRILNGMWQTSGGWGRIDRDDAVNAMLRYTDARLSTFDMADHYGPAEDLYGIFINRIRRERPPELLAEVKGLTKWVPPPVKMTSSYVRENINVSRKRMDVACLDMLQFHWYSFHSLKSCLVAERMSVAQNTWVRNEIGCCSQLCTIQPLPTIQLLLLCL